MTQPSKQYYPAAAEVDVWAEQLLEDARRTPCRFRSLGPYPQSSCTTMHMTRSVLLEFRQEGMRPFYGMWHCAMNGPRPLVVHLPGYGSELSIHPDVAAENYNLLELVPMGYWTPNGYDESLRHPETGLWPVLIESALDHMSAEGYYGWLRNAIGAILCMMREPSVLPDRVCFFGTSQGGGTSLLLGSIFAHHGTRCVCADEAFLTNYPLSTYDDVRRCLDVARRTVDEATMWRNLGYVDTLSHAHRMTYPVLLTLGTGDVVCPPETIQSLYDVLDTDKLLFSMRGRGHGHQFEFVRHVLTFLSLYA